MKKTNPYLTQNLSELSVKKNEFIKDLVTSRLSMDLTSLTSATNMQNLLRELKTATRTAAIKKKAKAIEVNQ